MNASLCERMLVLESVCAALDFRVERRIEFKTHLTPPWHFSYVPQIYGGDRQFLATSEVFLIERLLGLTSKQQTENKIAAE
jgi:hypothetical protein